MVLKEREMSLGYDKRSLYYDNLLNLPFREGTGVITMDEAKTHVPLPLNDPGGGSFAWGNLATGVPYLQFNAVGGGVADGVYLDCAAIDTVDMNFTTGDYSVCGWLNWSWNGFSSVIIGRYGVFLDGWELYLDISGGLNTLSHRHHHASLAPNTNSNSYSEDWTPGVWHFLGISRSGGSLYPLHYRNGIRVGVTYEASGMLDPDTCNRDLVIGCRYTKDANWYRGMLSNLRVWGRALSSLEMLEIFHQEQVLFL